MGCTVSSSTPVTEEIVGVTVHTQSERRRRTSTISETVSVAPSRRDCAASGESRQSTSTASSIVKESAIETPKTPPNFVVRVMKEHGDLVGASLGNTNTGAVIFSIQEGGILDKWNKANPQHVMRPGFIIQEVNGVRGYWNVLEEMRKPGQLVLKVTSIPPADAGPHWFQEITDMARSMEQQACKGPFMLRLQPQDPNATNRNTFSTLPSVKASQCGVDQCAICLDDVQPNETLVQLPCQHAFHALCAARWLAQTANRKGGKQQCCPLCCRKVVSTPEGGVCSVEQKQNR